MIKVRTVLTGRISIDLGTLKLCLLEYSFEQVDFVELVCYVLLTLSDLISELLT